MYLMIHSCIRVLNLEASEAFYQNAFDFEISRKKDFPEGGFTLTYLKAKDAPFEIELTYNYDQQEPYTIGNGYSHLAVGVADLEASHARHQEQGYNPGPIKGLSKGVGNFYFLEDPDGYKVEVVRTK